MCSPVLVPQMVGMALLPGADTPKVSTWQVPPWERRVDIFISIESCRQVMVSTLQTNFKVMTIYAHPEWTLPHCRCFRWHCLSSQRSRIVWLAGEIKGLRAIMYTWHRSPTSSLYSHSMQKSQIWSTIYTTSVADHSMALITDIITIIIIITIVESKSLKADIHFSTNLDHSTKTNQRLTKLRAKS